MSFRLIAPPHTPFHADLTLNLEAIEQQAALFANSAVDGVFVAGSTGEGQSLTTDERMQLAERWVEVGGRADLEVMIQVGHNAQGDAVQLAMHAQSIGADVVAASSPCYFRPETVDDLITFLEPVAAAASDLPFYFYEIPPFTEVRLPMVEFLVRAKDRIPNLVGLKYSNSDLTQMQQCAQLNDGEFEVLFGSDQILLAGIALGARGAVGTTYNFAAPLYRRMIERLEEGDLEAARAIQARSARMISIAIRNGGIAAFKAMMSMFGVDCGPVRPPLTPLSVEARRRLQSELDEIELRDQAMFATPVESSSSA